MRVEAIRVSLVGAPTQLLELGWTSQSRVAITRGKEYAAYALSVWRGNVNVLVIDDDDVPRFLPSWLFREINASMPSDWICSLFNDETALVLGPPLIAAKVEAYEGLVELDLTRVQRFRDYVQHISANEDGEST